MGEKREIMFQARKHAETGQSIPGISRGTHPDPRRPLSSGSSGDMGG